MVNNIINKGNTAFTTSLSDPNDLLKTVGLTAISIDAMNPAKSPDSFLPMKNAAIIAKNDKNNGVKKDALSILTFGLNNLKNLYKYASK